MVQLPHDVYALPRGYGDGGVFDLLKNEGAWPYDLAFFYSKCPRSLAGVLA
jgi:hypothetical protein